MHEQWVHFTALKAGTKVIFLIFFLTRGIRASLHAPQLIPGPTEHPASPVGR